MSSKDNLSPRTRKRIRIFFILLFPFLFLQYWYVMAVEEPYPAILMPMFGGVDGNGSIFNTLELDIQYEFPDTTHHFELGGFLGDMTESYRFHVMRRLMGPEADPAVHSDKGFREWLTNRCSDLTDRQDPRAFRVVWTSVEIETASDPAEVRKSPMGEFFYLFAEGQP